MQLKSTCFTALVAAVTSFTFACAQPSDDSDSANDRQVPSSSGGNGCALALSRSGSVAGTSIDYPTEPDTTWFNRSLEEVALGAIDEAVMKEAGLDIDDEEDVRRFRYFSAGFDLRWIVGDIPSSGNWFGKSDLSVYVFDLVRTSTPPDGTVAVFDASAVREARLSGDKARLGKAIRETVDAMKADPHPKAIIAFAPDRNPEGSVERAFINLFARNVYFATEGSVTISNLRGARGASVTSDYPLRNVQTLDVSSQGTVGGSAISASGSCLSLTISG